MDEDLRSLLKRKWLEGREKEEAPSDTATDKTKPDGNGGKGKERMATTSGLGEMPGKGRILGGGASAATHDTIAQVEIARKTHEDAEAEAEAEAPKLKRSRTGEPEPKATTEEEIVIGDSPIEDREAKVLPIEDREAKVLPISGDSSHSTSLDMSMAAQKADGSTVDLTVEDSDEEEDEVLILDNLVSKPQASHIAEASAVSDQGGGDPKENITSSSNTRGAEESSNVSSESQDAAGTSSSSSSSASSSSSQLKTTMTTTKATTSSADDSSGSSTSYALASYNVWFGPAHPEERMIRIASLLTAPPNNVGTKPLFIGLQEVTQELAQTLTPMLQSMGYTVELQPDVVSMGAYGCAVAVLTEDPNVDLQSITFDAFADSMMGRGLLWAHVRVKRGASTENLLVGTTHLESFIPNHYGLGRPYDGVKQRAAQLRQVKSIVEKAFRTKGLDRAHVLGDYNWDDEPRKRKGLAAPLDAPLLSLLGAEWTDAWAVARRKSPSDSEGYTYDAKLNPMLRGNLRRRLDRCLTFQPANGTPLAVHSVNLIGKDPIEELEWQKEDRKGQTIALAVLPSDHYGLWVIMGETDK